MLHKCPRCLWFRQKNRLNCYNARTFQKFFEKWRKKRGSTRRPADPIRLFHRPDLLNKRLLFQISSCVRNQGELHNQQDCYLLSDVYTKDHSSLMADKMLVFFNSDFAYTVKIKYITAKTTTNASRNSHGNTNVMQWFTASNRLQTITLKMLPNTRAITNEPPR